MTEKQRTRKTKTVPIGAIVPSRIHTRPRAGDGADFAELVRSNRADGRPDPRPAGPAARAKYEIVAGYRRWQAAKKAKQKTIRVEVLPLDDRAAAPRKPHHGGDGMPYEAMTPTAPAQQQPTQRREEEAMTDYGTRQANQLYAEFNTRFFDGRLGRRRVTLSRTQLWPGEYVSKRRLIRVQCGLPADLLRQTLLHEMCHIGTPGHGRAFQAKLARLAAQGESWAADAIAGFQQAATWNQEMAEIRRELPNLAERSPRPPLAKVARLLAKSFYPSHSARWLLRRAPWLPVAWRNVCREVDREKAEEQAFRDFIRREQAKQPPNAKEGVNR